MDSIPTGMAAAARGLALQAAERCGRAADPRQAAKLRRVALTAWAQYRLWAVDSGIGDPVPLLPPGLPPAGTRKAVNS